jgi:hypothetical protein
MAVVQLLALVIGAPPVLKGLVYEENSLFFFFSDSLTIMG